MSATGLAAKLRVRFAPAGLLGHLGPAAAKVRARAAAAPGLRPAAALLLGAGAALITCALAAPLAVGGADARAAAARFEEDLAHYCAADPGQRASDLVSFAAAGYEDRAFFSRPRWLPPLSPRGLARALVRNLRGVPEGASTIPQQLAKLYLRSGARGHLRDKLREIVFAVWLVRQAPPGELAGLYLNLSASATLGTERFPADGLHRLSLALFGLPLQRLSREDQLVLGAIPRGVSWLRAHPSLSARRIEAARTWLIAQGRWDASAPSYVDTAIDPDATFRFVDGWTERVASGGGADLDLVAAIDQFREGLAVALAADFPDAQVHAAMAAIGASGAVLARSGAEAALMPVNYGSIAKLEALDFAVEAFGPQAVRDLPLAPAPCVRWIWASKDQRRARATSWCPNDVQPAAHPMAFDEAVARSVNSLTARHALLLPGLLQQRRPELLQRISQTLTEADRAALDSPADRALAGGQLAQLGQTVAPEDVPPQLSYSAASVALFRHLKDRREQAGLPAARLPDDPTSLLGNSSRATAEQIGGYLHRKLFAGDGTCALSDTGALLSLRRKEGTLRWLAQRWPRLVFSGKTGSSPHDDAAVAAVALCLDARPVVLAAVLRPVQGTLPLGLRGSVVLRGLDAYLRELSRLERTPGSAVLPDWAADQGAEPRLVEASR